MANYYAADWGQKVTRTPEGGNGYNEDFRYVHPTGGIAAGSKIYYGVIPAGVKINNVREIHDANAASLTLKLGFEPVNSTNGPTADDDAFFAATASTTAGEIQGALQPVSFDFPVMLVGVTAGATSDAAAVSTVVVSGKVVGVP